MEFMTGHDNIFNLARILIDQGTPNCFSVRRDSWCEKHYLIVKSVSFNDDTGYGYASGVYCFSGKKPFYAKIDCAGCYTWHLNGFLDSPLKISHFRKT